MTDKHTPTVAVPGECPFCGSDDLEFGHSEQYDESKTYDIKCNKCQEQFEQIDTITFSHYNFIDKDGENIEVYPQTPQTAADLKEAIEALRDIVAFLEENHDHNEAAMAYCDKGLALIQKYEAKP